MDFLRCVWEMEICAWKAQSNPASEGPNYSTVEMGGGGGR